MNSSGSHLNATTSTNTISLQTTSLITDGGYCMWTVLGPSLRVSIRFAPLSRPRATIAHRGIRIVAAMTPLPQGRLKRSNTICYDATSTAPLRGATESSTSIASDSTKPYYQHLTNTGSEPGVDVRRDA